MFEGLPADALVGHSGPCTSNLGPKKLPELGKGLGEGLRGFTAAMSPIETPNENTKEKT